MNSNKIKDMNDVFEEGFRLSHKAEILRPDLQTIENMLLKLGEEYGELCTDILKLKQYKVNNEKAEDVEQNAKEEAIDILLMIINIMNKLGMDKKDIVDIAQEKLNKWDIKHLEKK